MFVYLDESGDTGFKFDRGSSRYFVVTLLLVDDPIPLHAAVDELRLTLRYPPRVEFRFAKSSIAVREQFLRTIAPLQFQVRALIVNKELLTRPHLRSKESLYNYFVRQVLDHHLGAIRGARLILDESVRSKKAKTELRTYLRRMLNTRQEDPKLTKITYHRSHTDNLLQVSDMVCGAIFARYEKSEDRYYRLIQDHIQDERPL